MMSKWLKKLNKERDIRLISVNDFAKSFGADEKEVFEFCKEIIEKMNFKYKVCPLNIREKIFLDVIKKCEDDKFSVSGPHRESDWKQGWGEIFEDFIKTNKDLKSLIPKDIHTDRPLRWNGEYIISESNSFEHDFSSVFRTWLFKKYFNNYNNIYEFGCGTGHNLVFAAKIFPDRNFFGGDWVLESKKILQIVKENYKWKMQGFLFDFFNPDYNIEILPESLVYTSAALEQVGDDYKKFIDFLLAKKPKLCVNVECINEFYNKNSLFDYVALKYHKKRNYLGNLLTYLQGLEKEGKIKIIAKKRLNFGSLYHEVFSYIVWKPL